MKLPQPILSAFAGPLLQKPCFDIWSEICLEYANHGCLVDCSYNTLEIWLPFSYMGNLSPGFKTDCRSRYTYDNSLGNDDCRPTDSLLLLWLVKNF